MSGGYPVVLDLAGRLAVVVGGGRVGARRAAALSEAGARVRVIAPQLDPALESLAAGGGSPAQPPALLVERRPYRDGDLDGAWLAEACTDDPQVNAAVAAEAERQRIWCARSDSADGRTVRTPAAGRSGDVLVAVASGDPRRSAAIRDAVLAGLDTGAVEARPARPAARGSVALIGGGPGDPELITVRGRRLLAEADVIVTDRLAPTALLATTSAEVVDVGKRPGEHKMSQDKINALLIERARAGQRVARLKGGDPFVFGRGGEELAACVAAGVPVQVVPGVSSAVAAPVAAGIPLTHRGVAADFAVVSAHLDRSSAGSPMDWSALAGGAATLVLLMAMDRLPQVVRTLTDRGRRLDEPVAVVHNATLPAQRVLVTTLGRLVDDVAEAGLGSPSVVIVGEVVRLAAPAGTLAASASAGAAAVGAAAVGGGDGGGGDNG